MSSTKFLKEILIRRTYAITELEKKNKGSTCLSDMRAFVRRLKLALFKALLHIRCILNSKAFDSSKPFVIFERLLGDNTECERQRRHTSPTTDVEG